MSLLSFFLVLRFGCRRFGRLLTRLLLLLKLFGFVLSPRFFLAFPFGLGLVGWQQQTPLPRCLNVGLVVATNAIANGDKVKVVRIKDVAVLLGEFNQSLREQVVELLLLDRVVARRKLEVLVAVVNQEPFQLPTKKGARVSGVL